MIIKPIRNTGKAYTKLYSFIKDDRIKPMKYINWYCRFCCPHIKDEGDAIGCQNPVCLFGVVKAKMDSVRNKNCVLSPQEGMETSYPTKDIGGELLEACRGLREPKKGIGEIILEGLWDFVKGKR